MRWITRPGWPGNLLALAAGALTPLAFAPFDFWPLQLLCIGLFYLGLRDLTANAAFRRGWCFGLGLYLAGTGWIYVSIHDYGAASVPLAGFLTLGFSACVALFFALPAWLWARWLRRSEAPLADALAFAALWLAQEAFRGWFLTGFPWLYAGYTQLEGPLAGLAPDTIRILFLASIMAKCRLVRRLRIASTDKSSGSSCARIGSLPLLCLVNSCC